MYPFEICIINYVPYSVEFKKILNTPDRLKTKGDNFNFRMEEKKNSRISPYMFILFYTIIMQKIEYRNHTLFDISSENVSFKMAKIY